MSGPVLVDAGLKSSVLRSGSLQSDLWLWLTLEPMMLSTYQERDLLKGAFVKGPLKGELLVAH